MRLICTPIMQWNCNSRCFAWFWRINLIEQLNVSRFLILQASVHGRFLFSFGIGHFIQILVDDVVELSLQPKKRIFSSREMIKIGQINPFNSRRIHECPERSPWSRRRWPRPCHGPVSGSPSGDRGSFVRLTGYFWNLSHFFWTSWWRLTTCVSLEALATASPRSVKYLNSWDRKRRLNVCSDLKASPAGCGGGVTQQHLKTDLKCASGLLVDVGLESVGFGLHCSDPLQDFLLSDKTSLKLKVSGGDRAGVLFRRGYLDGNSEVIPIFYFRDEVLNPGGNLRWQTEVRRELKR